MSTKGKGGFLRIPPAVVRPLGRDVSLRRKKLLAGSGIGRSFSRSGVLGYAQIATSGGLANLVDYQLKRLAAAAGVEEDRLINGTVFLLEVLVISEHVNGELVFLDVGVLQFHLHRADFLRAGFARDGELKVIALAHAAQLIDLVVVARDQGAHFAASHLQVVLGRVKIVLYAGNIAPDFAHVISAGLSCELLIHVRV